MARRYHISQLTQWTMFVSKSIRHSLWETAQAIFEELREEGKPITYPVHWDSERQRKAYFATGGFGQGIPYMREGFYEASGSVERTEFGARMFKPHPAGAIGGTFQGWQSNIHKGRWPRIIDVVERELKKLPERIRARIRVEEGSL